MKPLNQLLYKAFILSFFLCLFYAPPAIAAEEDKQLDIGGYYKNLFTTSKTTSTIEEFVSCLQRVRIKANKKFTDKISATVMYDNEVLLNDFSHTPDFDIIKQQNQRSLAFWDADHVLFDERHLYWKHGIYRAYLQYHTPSLQCILGKQAIDWSRMRFYHPFDLFNPISPLDIEGDEKFGVDAINVEYYPEEFMMFNLIYAPHRDREQQAAGLRFLTKFHDYDIFLMGAEVKKDKIIGCGFDGYIKEAGFRGELTLTYKDDHDKFLRSALGLDYSFSPKLYGLIEYFYNGDAKIINAGSFLGSYEFSRRALSITKHILGAGLEYEFSGITKLNNYVFCDFEGESIFYNPEFKWNVQTNTDLSVGAQVFEGDDESEYGNYHNLFYTELKLFF